MNLSDELKEWRGAATAREAAECLNVPLGTYQGWEANRPPSGAMLALLRIAMRHEKPVRKKRGGDVACNEK